MFFLNHRSSICYLFFSPENFYFWLANYDQITLIQSKWSFEVFLKQICFWFSFALRVYLLLWYSSAMISTENLRLFTIAPPYWWALNHTLCFCRPYICAQLFIFPGATFCLVSWHLSYIFTTYNSQGETA